MKNYFVNYFVIMALLPVCLYAQTAHTPSQLTRMGLCTTMKEHYLPDSLDTLDCEIIPFNSSMSVLAALRAGRIDIAYVGRPAHRREGVADMDARALRSGWTIVGSSKRFIDESDLATAVVHTTADSHTIAQYLPATVTVRQHESIFAALEDCGDHELVFLPWEEYDETYPLVIPFNSKGKIPHFRRPVIYRRKDDKRTYQSVVKAVGDYVSQKEIQNR
ncbi:MAG: hypothetical protein ACLFSB_12125 [Chitinispirillaceae bacterium]